MIYVLCAVYPFCTITGKKTFLKKNQHIAVSTNNYMQISCIQKFRTPHWRFVKTSKKKYDSLKYAIVQPIMLPLDSHLIAFLFKLIHILVSEFVLLGSFTSTTFQFKFSASTLSQHIPVSSHVILSLAIPNMKNEGSGNVTGLKFESRTRTQSRTRSPI